MKINAAPTVAFIGVSGIPLPTSSDRIADAELHGLETEHVSGGCWEFDCDMRAIVAKFFASFADDSFSGEPNLYITGETSASRRVIQNRLPAALRAEAQRRHTEAAAFLFQLRVGDVISWAVEFATTWAHVTAIAKLSNEFIAVTGKGFQATARLEDKTDAKADWRDDLRKLAADFTEPFVQSFHGRPGRESKAARDLAAQAFRNRRREELEPSVGRQRAMEIAKRETMVEFDLKTNKVYQNAMERKEPGAVPSKRKRSQQDVN